MEPIIETVTVTTTPTSLATLLEVNDQNIYGEVEAVLEINSTAVLQAETADTTLPITVGDLANGRRGVMFTNIKLAEILLSVETGTGTVEILAGRPEPQSRTVTD